MANEIIVEPDLQFTKDLIAAGAGDLKKCYQCGTCSVACRISPDNIPYPRKEMIWAQWGLKDKLLNDPDVWLCHQCNDCSVQCPRGANPGDVLKAVRKMNVRENSWPSFLGKLAGSPGMIILAAGIPTAVVLLIVYISGWSFPAGPVKYTSHSIAHRDGFIYLPAIQVVFAAVLIFAAASLVMSLKSYWNQLESSNPVGMSGSGKGFVPSLIESLKEILPHTTFKECETNRIRYAAHLLAFWGIIGLFVTTTIVSFNCDILSLKPPSQTGPGTIPIKMLGNVSAISLVLGLAIMLVRRLTRPDEAGSSTYFDWFFLLTIIGAGASGLSTELSRWVGLIGTTYTLFVIHLMFVLTLFLYLPFSKFAHLGYRTVAIVWSKSVGRNKTLPVAPNYVPPASAEAAEQFASYLTVPSPWLEITVLNANDEGGNSNVDQGRCGEVAQREDKRHLFANMSTVLSPPGGVSLQTESFSRAANRLRIPGLPHNSRSVRSERFRMSVTSDQSGRWVKV